MQILTFDEFKKKMERQQQGAGAATSPAPAATPAPQDNSVQAKSLEETAGMLAAPSFEWISGGNPDMNGNPTFVPAMGPTPTATLDRIHEDLAAQAQDPAMAGPALETIRQGKVLSPEEFKAAQDSWAATHPQAGAQGGTKPAQWKPKDALEETAQLLALEGDVPPPSGGRYGSRYGKGNIDLYDRDTGLYDEDGSLMTVRSMSFGEDGKEILVPTVVKKDGKWQVLSDDEAIDWYHKTGEYLGKFDTVEEANAYADSLHRQQEDMYARPREEQQAPQAEASGTGPAIAASAEGKTPEGASPGTADTEQPKPGSDAFLIQQAQKNALKTQREGLQEQYNELAANIYGAGKKIGVDYTAEDVEKLNAMEEQIRGLDEQIDAMQRDVSAGQAIGRNVFAGLEGAGLAGTQALDWLLGENSAPWWFVKEAAPMFGLDLEGKNPVTKLRQKGEEEVAYWRQKGAEAVEGNDLWEQIGRHTQSISQSAPFLVINLMTLGGAGLAGASTEGLQYLSQIGEASGGFRAVSTMAANGIKALAQNPAAEYSFISTFGQSYADAIADGASETEATLYAVLNGSFNAMIEVGGADEALGGMQNVPKDVRDALLSGDKNLVLKWIKETGQEIGEEEFQNFVEKGFRGIYTDVPVYSTTDENAIFNPNVMLQTAKDTAIDAGLMTAGNLALQTAAESGQQRQAQAALDALARTQELADAEARTNASAERGAGARASQEAQRQAVEAALAQAEARMGQSGGAAGVAAGTGTQAPAGSSGGTAGGLTASGRQVAAGDVLFRHGDYSGTAYRVLGTEENGDVILETDQGERFTAPRGFFESNYEHLHGSSAEAAAGQTAGAAGGTGTAAGGPAQAQEQAQSVEQTVDAPVQSGVITEGQRGQAAGAVAAAQGAETAAPAGGTGEAAGRTEARGGTDTAEQGETARRGDREEFNSGSRGGDATQSGGSVTAASGQTQGSAGSTGSAAGSVTQTGTQTGEQAQTQTGEETQAGESRTPESVQEQQTQEEQRQQTQERQEQQQQQEQEQTETRTPAEQHTEEVLEQTEARQQGQGGTQTQTPTVSGTALEGVVTDDQLPRLRASLPDAQAVLDFAEQSNFTGDQTVALAEALGVELPEGTRLPDGRRVTPREAADTSGMRGGVEIHEAPGGPRVAASGGGTDSGDGGRPVRGGGGRATVASGSGGSGGSGGGRGGGGEGAGRLSRFWTNTLRSLETREGVPEDVSTPLRYMPVSEAESLARAASMLAEDEAGTVEDLVSSDTWTGAQNDAAYMIRERLRQAAEESGDWEAYDAWRRVLRAHESEAGRALQSNAKYTRDTAGIDIALDALDHLDEIEDLDPAERARIRRDVVDAGRELDAARRSGDLGDIRDLIEHLSNLRNTGTFIPANFRRLLNDVNDFDYLYEYAARQIQALVGDAGYHPGLGEQMKTWQVASQLTRLTTFLRNLGGNFAFGIQDTLTQNGLAVAIDTAISRITGRRSVGFDVSQFGRRNRQAARQAATLATLEIAGDIDMTGELNRWGQRQGGRTNKMSGGMFSRFMSRWEQLLGYSLTVPDRRARGRYEESIRNGLIAAGVDEETARQIAHDDASYRLFQNRGVAYGVSKGLHDIMNLAGVGGTVDQNNISHGRQGGFGLGDLINPYPGVPANLAVKALEYSPANALKGIFQLLRGGRNISVVDQHNAVMNFARGLAGTGMIAAMTALFNGGVLRNTDDEDDPDAIAQMRAEGKNGIQLNLSAAERWLNGESAEWRDGDDLMSFSWLEPLNAFFGMASMIADERRDADHTFWSVAGRSFEGAFKGVLEMPVFTNIQNAVNAANYSTADNFLGTAADVGISLLGDAASGMIPAPIGQIARTADDVYRDVTGDTKLDTVLNNLANGIPGLRERLPEKQDNFGNPKEYPDSALQRFLNNFVLPGAVNELNQTEVGAATEALYKATGDPEVYPDRKAPNSFTASSIKHTLTADEKRTYHATYGGICEAAYGDLFGPDFDYLSDEEKASVCKDVKAFANYAAKKEYMQGIGEDYSSTSWDKTWARVQNGERLADVLTDSTASVKVGGSVGNVLETAGLGREEAQAMAADVLAAAPDGDKTNALTQADVYAYWLAHPESEDYMKALWESMAWSKSWEAYKTSQQKKQK